MAKDLPSIAGDLIRWRRTTYGVSALIIVATWLLGLAAMFLYARSAARSARQLRSVLESAADGNIGGSLEKIRARRGKSDTGPVGGFSYNFV